MRNFCAARGLRLARGSSDMPRYRLVIEYDGGAFSGWQRQTTLPSVQQALETTIATLTRENVSVFCAGRTDAGVHARAQVVHVDLERAWGLEKLREGLNFYIRPHAIAVLEIAIVADDFSARHSALARHYVYRILNRRAPPALQRGFVWHIMRNLDADAMHEAAQVLVGHHDFTTFRAAECQANSPMRTLDHLSVVRKGELVEIYASARSFLHHQVRSMVGSLEHVGSGRWSADDLRAALVARDRTHCGPNAPPDGLYLIGVDYPGWSAK